jgi:hypothetical protein
MIINTYTKINRWTAVARFPHANNPYKYHEYDYRGFGENPQEAVNELMSQLAANEYVYDFIYFIPERLTRYNPITRYNHWDKDFFCQIWYELPYRSESSALGQGATPDDAFAAAILAIALDGVHVPPNQRRTATDLFSLDDVWIADDNFSIY